MLDKELDKLRDKTISFWCHIIWSKWEWIIIWNEMILFWEKVFHWFDTQEMIWHPLTYWRIYSLSYKLRNTKSWKVADEILYNKTDIERILKENDLIDKSELERQTHEKRSELKELLIQFSNYLL